MKVPGGFAAIRQILAIANYRLYVIGHLTSNSGLWVQRIAIGWLTWDLTESAGWLGLIAFADQVPTILLGLIAGAVVDRENGRRARRRLGRLREVVRAHGAAGLVKHCRKYPHTKTMKIIQKKYS